MSSRLSRLPEGYAVRPASFDDLATIIEVSAACQVAEYGERDVSLDELRAEWQVPGFDPATDSWLITGTNGRALAAAYVWTESGIQIYSTASVLPTECGKGIGSHLLRLIEARAGELMARAPDGARVTLSASVAEPNAAGQHLLERQGYALVRQYWQMRIDMDAAPPVPNWPEGVTLRPFVTERDARAAFDAIDEAFGDHWGHLPMEYAVWEHLALHGPDFEPGRFHVAWDGDAVAGVAFCGRRAEVGWVHQLAVRRPWRKQGLGRALLLYAFGDSWRRGERGVGLSVDAQNLTGALRLYESAGMRPVRQFDRFEKVLRVGTEMATQALT